MYYFLPKAAERPVYSYRLSVVHFWSLVFLYIWAGPHHLLNTSLPVWLQSLGIIFFPHAVGAELEHETIYIKRYGHPALRS